MSRRWHEDRKSWTGVVNGTSDPYTMMSGLVKRFFSGPLARPATRLWVPARGPGSRVGLRLLSLSVDVHDGPQLMERLGEFKTIEAEAGYETEAPVVVS